MVRKSKTEQTSNSYRSSFSGFDRPDANWFRMPNKWTNITADIDNLAELKVVEYILRHTWGYQEYGIKKHITVDEFVHGRKRQDSTRIDKGTGLSERGVRYGLQKAVGDGLIEEEVDDSDRGRVKKYYSLRMKDQEELESEKEAEVHDLQSGVQSLHPRVQDLPPRGVSFAPRTEKETKERNLSNSNIRKATPFFEKNEERGTEHKRRPDPGIPDRRPPTSRTSQTTPTPTISEAPSETTNSFFKSRIPHVEVAHRPLSYYDQFAGSASSSVNPSEPDIPATPDNQAGFQSAGSVLNAAAKIPGRPHLHSQAETHSQSRPRSQSQNKHQSYDEDRQVILEFIEDFAREFNDQAPLKSSTTRAYNLYQQSSLPIGSFIAKLHEARSITKESTAQIRSESTGKGRAGPAKKKMAYWFSVVEDLLGLRERGEET